MARKLPLHKNPKRHYEDSVTAFGNVIHIPDTIVKGKLEVTALGQSVSQLIEGDSLDGWQSTERVTMENEYLRLDTSGAISMYYPVRIQSGHNYFVKFISYRDTTQGSLNLELANNMGDIISNSLVETFTMTPQEYRGILTATDNGTRFSISRNQVGGIILIRGITLIDLTSRGDTEMDLSTLSRKYHYTARGESHTPSGTLQIVGKNLIPKDNIKLGHNQTYFMMPGMA